jgi:hypothetical protein
MNYRRSEETIVSGCKESHYHLSLFETARQNREVERTPDQQVA